MYYYDDNGNLFSKTEAGDANNTVVYSWDQRDLLLSVFEPAGDTYYEYDGNGNRISKTRNGVTTRYINDQARSLVQVLAETDVNGVTQKSYTYGNDLISMKTAYSKSYYHYDGLGSVRNLTNSTCAVTADYTYDGFGNLITSTGVSENNYGFTGEQQFAEADGLVFLRARYYDTETGRFIKRDPLGVDPAGGEYNPFDPVRQYADGVNIYVYVQNNPVINIDPYGLKCHYKQRCRKIGRIYICPPQNSPVNCQDCCDHLINDFAKPSWLNPCKRLKWFLSRKNLITACYIGCQGQVPIIVF
jgi:RHS repeat-associated protein